MDMPYYRVTRMSRGGLLARGVFVVMLAIIALVCVANRSWLESKALGAIHGDRPKIHAGGEFTPGATAVEDGVRQTAVLIGGTPHVRVTSPPPAWFGGHPDASCERGACVAAATRQRFAGGGLGLGAVLAMLLAGFVAWTLIIGDARR